MTSVFESHVFVEFTGIDGIGKDDDAENDDGCSNNDSSVVGVVMFLSFWYTRLEFSESLEVHKANTRAIYFAARVENH